MCFKLFAQLLSLFYSCSAQADNMKYMRTLVVWRPYFLASRATRQNNAIVWRACLYVGACVSVCLSPFRLSLVILPMKSNNFLVNTHSVDDDNDRTVWMNFKSDNVLHMVATHISRQLRRLMSIRHFVSNIDKELPTMRTPLPPLSPQTNHHTFSVIRKFTNNACVFCLRLSNQWVAVHASVPMFISNEPN